jgi:hypothetical protein
MATKRIGTWQLAAAGILSVGTALAANAVLHRVAIDSRAIRLAIALLPLPFFIAFIVAEFRWMQGQDEFHRRLMLESLAIAFPFAIALAVLMEALQKAGFLSAFGIGDAWPLMALVWVPSLWIAARRYR